MAVVGTLNVSDAGTRRAPSIEDRIRDGLRMSVSATVGRTLTLGQSQRASSGFADAELGLGMISKRHLFKGTFGFEMHLMLQGSAVTH
jgi:hypothetical protein